MQKAYLRFEEFDADHGFTAKCGFNVTPIQIADIETMVFWDRSLNSMEVGCGKTVISSLVSLMRGVDVTIVTAPPILIRAWVEWLEKVSERVVAWQGIPSIRKKLDISKARWIVVSHALFRDDFDLLQASLAVRKDAKLIELIVDEAHGLKNVRSILFKKVQTFSAGDRFLQMLTGTPVNKPLDAYSYIKLKSPKLYRSMGHFEAVHVEERDFWKTPTKYANLKLMRENLALQTISRTKEEVHGYNLKPLFPDSHYDLAPEHLKLYTKLVDEQLLEFSDGQVIDATGVQALRHALQQVIVNYDHFSNDPENRSKSYNIIDLSLEETECATIGKTKLIIWTKYRRTTEAVLAYLNKSVKSVAAYGNGKSSQEMEKFLKDETVRVLVAQYQSANAGLNPQYVCNEALFLEGETVPLYMRQAVGRIDRTGQTKVPRIRLATARNTVQEGLFASLLKNDDLVKQIEPTKKSIRAMLLGEI